MARGAGNGRGRPLNHKTRLGRVMISRGFHAYQVCGKTGIYDRLMTEYLAGRRVISPDHVKALCDVLDCQPSDIVEPGLKHNLTQKTGLPMDRKLSSVKEIDMSHIEPYNGPIPEYGEAVKTPPVPLPELKKPVAPQRITRKVG